MSDAEELPLPRWGCLLFAVPVLAIGAVFGAYGYLGLHVWQGRPVEGARVVLEGRACGAAGPVLLDRVTMMGLGDPVLEATQDGFRLTVTMPDDPEVANEIPATLEEPGAVRLLLEDGTLVADHVAGASIRLDLRMVPSTVLALADREAVAAAMKAHPTGALVVELDGTRIGSVPNAKVVGDELEIEPDIEDERQKMHRAASWAVAIAHPLPCPVTVAPAR